MTDDTTIDIDALRAAVAARNYNVDNAPPATVAAPVGPPAPYTSDNPDIAKAQAALAAALTAAISPIPRRPPTPEDEAAGRSPKRPGFAE